LHSAIIVRALLLTASREDRREDERTVRLLRGEFSAVGAELTFQSAQARARCVRVGRSLAEGVLDLQTQLGTDVGSGDGDRGAGSVPACVPDRFLLDPRDLLAAEVLQPPAFPQSFHGIPR